MNAVYKLKPMVAARLLAEVTALLICLALPVFLLMNAALFKSSPLIAGLCVAVALVSLVVLPAYGFVTYKVAVDDAGLRTFSWFRKQFAAWGDIKTLQLKTSWGWRRYVVSAGSGDLSFPIWLKGLPELCSTIRSRLPNGGSVAGIAGGGGPSAPKSFVLAPSAVVLQWLKLVGNVIFIGLFWTFFANMTGHHGAKPDPSDRIIMLLACLSFTTFMVSRVAFYLLSPKRVVTDDDGLQVQTAFFQRKYPWGELKSATPSLFWLPEGLLLRTKRGVVVIGDQLDAFDELQEVVAKHLPPPTVPANKV